MAAQTDLPSSADFARLEGELFRRIAVRHRRQVLRHRLVAAVAVLVVAGAGVAAGTIANPSQQRNLAYCYSAPTTSSTVSQSVIPGNDALRSKSDSKPSPARIAKALHLCEGTWQAGLFNKTSATGPFPVPRLQVCLRDDLAVAVFPKKDANQSATAFCENLGQSAP